MRLRFLPLLALPLLTGCPVKKTDPPSAGTASGGTTPPAATGTGTASSGTTPPSATTPTTPVAGQINGKPFKPDQVFLEGTSLTFRQGKGFFADLEVQITIPKEELAKMEGEERRWGNKFGDPFVLLSYKEGKDLPTQQHIAPTDYTLTLRVTKRTAKSVEGTINLAVTKPGNTNVAGVFQATVKKTAFDPLDADDAPYVQGKVTIAGDWKTEQIAVGFVGKDADGKPRSNSVGSKVSSGEATWMTNASFEPQITSMTNDAKAGPAYRHTHMRPGEYWVFARRNGVMAAWKKVTVKAGDQQTVDLTIDPAKTGELVVTIPDEEAKEKDEWHLSLIPADIESPGIGWDHVFNAAEVKSGQKTVTVKGVPPGKYKLLRGQSEGTAEVTVGKSTAVTLVRNDPKKKP